MNWLLKTEPEEFSYHHLEAIGRSTWDGVRNPVALANIRRMAPGELAFIYHTGKQKAIVGVAEIQSQPYPDENGYPVVDITPVSPLNRAVSLREIKSEPEFSGWELVRQPRLSVMSVPAPIWQRVIDISINS